MKESVRIIIYCVTSGGAFAACYVYTYGGVTNCCQISYTPTEILFEITEITRFLKSEIKKIGMEISKIL